METLEDTFVWPCSFQKEWEKIFLHNFLETPEAVLEQGPFAQLPEGLEVYCVTKNDIACYLSAACHRLTTNANTWKKHINI